MSKLTYKESGVDLEKYADAMARLPKHVEKTFSSRVLRNPGGFAGLFHLDAASKAFTRNYKDPVLVSCTDGVGTKLKVAGITGKHDTVGIDLVAMSINDAICCGAEPLFFLDYVAMGKDDPELLEQIVKGISDGCCESGCALLGGETAIMPDIYAEGDYDLAGFCVGVVDRERMLTGEAIRAGDVVIGVSSDGLHSNGFSLVRKIVFEAAGLGIDDQIDELGCSVGEELLRPTRIYAKPVVELLTEVLADDASAVHGIAHITGGGLSENIERILPDGVQLSVHAGSWSVPPVFTWLQNLGEVDDSEMERVFNMGLGLAIVLNPTAADQVQAHFGKHGLTASIVGEISAK